jgi:hypothetical protein
MSARTPYAEVEHLANDGPLHALHNLTAHDVRLVMDALSSRRLVAAIRLEDRATPRELAETLRRDADRMDLLHHALKTLSHGTTVEHTAHRG